jgi:excisionase family DNA binding protein
MLQVIINTKGKEKIVMKTGTVPEPDDLIYVEDVIAMFGGKISRNIVYAWVREKKLPAMKVGRRFVFSRKRVQSYMARHLGIAS